MHLTIVFILFYFQEQMKKKLYFKSFSCNGTDDGQVDHPRGIITQDNFIWVVDSGNNRIQKFSLL